MKKRALVTGKLIKTVAASVLTMGLVLMMMPIQTFAADSPPDTPGGGIEPAPTVVEESQGPYYSSLLDTIGATESGTIEYSEGDSLPLEVMQELAKNPSLELKFTYKNPEGEEKTVTIPGNMAAALIDEDIPWYGYLWLEEHFGEAKDTKVAYQIQPGDTLNGIAKRFGTTVNAIMESNTEIGNPNLIPAGGTIVVDSKMIEDVFGISVEEQSKAMSSLREGKAQLSGIITNNISSSAGSKKGQSG